MVRQPFFACSIKGNNTAFAAEHIAVTDYVEAGIARPFPVGIQQLQLLLNLVFP